MDEGSIVAIIGLVLGLLPAALVALAIIIVGVLISLLFGLVWMFSQHPWCWVFCLSLVFNAVVLVPVWTVALIAASYEPDLWAKAEVPVFIFSIAFMAPTVLFYGLWKRAERQRSASDENVL